MNKLDVIKSKIVGLEDLNKRLTLWHFKGLKIIFTNGCFDILHKGHVEYLAKAANLGDILIVGLNTDSSVRNIKGPDRPYQDEDSRAVVMASLHFVDAVILFAEDTPHNLIQQIKPDFLVKGSDYKPEEVVGADIVTSYGGEVVTIDLVKGYSTTFILENKK
ncbi:MAG: D-glycero-beta-D-manno-heptose 1-phosphate adenylyltransferase [Bacteroidales bacterium]|nr:D-glycero-beta-D-manno-heptose 1-phosphate adenylyltransferase [Bacteroidales bacterium]